MAAKKFELTKDLMVFADGKINKLTTGVNEVAGKELTAALDKSKLAQEVKTKA